MIARNLSIDLRRATRAEVECDPDLVASGPGPERATIDRDELRAVLASARRPAGSGPRRPADARRRPALLRGDRRGARSVGGSHQGSRTSSPRQARGGHEPRKDTTMTKITRDVISDLWPVYASGERRRTRGRLEPVRLAAIAAVRSTRASRARRCARRLRPRSRHCYSRLCHILVAPGSRGPDNPPGGLPGRCRHRPGRWAHESERVSEERVRARRVRMRAQRARSIRGVGGHNGSGPRSAPGIRPLSGSQDGRLHGRRHDRTRVRADP